MKVARLAVLGVAIAAAGGAFFVATNLSEPQPPVQAAKKETQPQIKLTEVLVAAEDISLGQGLNPDLVKWQKWPKDTVARGFITRDASPDGLKDIESAIARASIFTGEPIRESKLVWSENGFMAAILPSGARAIATTISTATGAGGFVLPNDRVDVIMTRRANEDEGGEFITETILENIRVLAIDQTIEEKEGKKVKVGETATLQLSPEQAKILTVAQQMADRLALSLRSLADANEETPVGAEYLLNGTKGKGRIRVIKFGTSKEIVAGPKNDE